MLTRVVVLVGDFSLHPADEAKIQVDCPSSQGAFQNHVGPFTRRWMSILDMFAEIKLPQPSHLSLRPIVLTSLLDVLRL